MKRYVLALAATIGLAFATSSASAQAPGGSPEATCPALQAQAEAAAQGKFAFILFYRDDNDAARTMSQQVAALTAARPESAAAIYVQITNPAERAIVDRYDVARAPMPLTFVTAPNGAITGAYPVRVTPEQLAASFVTRAMAGCMKSMQQGRLVFLCLQTGPQPLVPLGVMEFLSDPHYKDRTDVVFVSAADPSEAELLNELQFVSTASGPQTNTAFFAPPGALVGKFGPASTKVELTTALHKAGKCCDDPHCKHGHAAQAPGGTVR